MDDAALGGRTALVTASSRALGAEIARALAAHGARVAVTYHTSEDAARELVAELHEQTRLEHAAVPGDVSDDAGVTSLVDRASDALGGRIDILVNNAGPYSATPLTELSSEELDRILAENLKAAFLASKLCYPAMREAGWGRIVNLSAVSVAVRNRGAYGLAKNAVEYLTEELALELAPHVTVNAVSPGQIAESAEDMAEFDPTWVERAEARTPLGRLGRRSEIAEVVARLCTPAFDMVTGATIPLDGGLRLHRF